MKVFILSTLIILSLSITESELNLEAPWSTHFNKIFSEVKKIPMKKISVAAAEDSNVLEAVAIARAKGIADAILVGNEEKIKQIAKEENIDISKFEIINEPDPRTAAMKAVKLVHDGKCDLFMTDGGFIIEPTLEEKVHLIENAVKVAHACGIEQPKVAPLCAVEVVNPKMRCTTEAFELTKLNEKGEIKNCIVDGPISLDMAISREACEHKGTLDRKITGDADVLLFPDIHSNNIAAKFVAHTAEHFAGMILSGTSAPVILTSRSDDIKTKVSSIAFASYIAENMKKNKKGN